MQPYSREELYAKFFSRDIPLLIIYEYIWLYQAKEILSLKISLLVRNEDASEVEALARVLLPKIQAFFESEEGQREFAEWKVQQEQDKMKRD